MNIQVRTRTVRRKYIYIRTYAFVVELLIAHDFCTEKKKKKTPCA